jgi:hypothetical protein
VGAAAAHAVAAARAAAGLTLVGLALKALLLLLWVRALPAPWVVLSRWLSEDPVGRAAYFVPWRWDAPRTTLRIAAVPGAALPKLGPKHRAPEQTHRRPPPWVRAVSRMLALLWLQLLGSLAILALLLTALAHQPVAGMPLSNAPVLRSNELGTLSVFQLLVLKSVSGAVTVAAAVVNVDLQVRVRVPTTARAAMHCRVGRACSAS